MASAVPYPYPTEWSRRSETIHDMRLVGLSIHLGLAARLATNDDIADV